MQGVGYGVSVAGLRSTQATHASSLASAGLFLGLNRVGELQPYLRLIDRNAKREGVGAIEIRSFNGVHTYSAMELVKARKIPLSFRTPVAEVSGSGSLAQLCEVVSARLAWFRETDNYFRASERGGRLLAPDEPLEEAEQYFLVTRSPDALQRKVAGVESCCVLSTGDGWSLHEVAISTIAEAGDRVRLEAYLGRDLIEPRSAIYIADPLPHHVEADGTHVFPENAGTLLLRQRGTGRVTLNQDGDVVELPQEEAEGGAWVWLGPVGPGEFSICVDDREELLGSVADCDFFLPEGVRIRLDSCDRELFEPQATLGVAAVGTGETIRLECPSTRIAERTAKGSPGWLRDGVFLTHTRSDVRTKVEGGNFGSLTLPQSLPVSGFEHIAGDPTAAAREAWIRGILLRFGGANGDIVGPKASRDLSWLRHHMPSRR